MPASGCRSLSAPRGARLALLAVAAVTTIRARCARAGLLMALIASCLMSMTAAARAAPLGPVQCVSHWTSADAGRQYYDVRPPWPVTVEDVLRSSAPEGRWEFAIDLAAGTGKLTERVAAVSAAVIAVEPSAPLRALGQVLQGDCDPGT